MAFMPIPLTQGFSWLNLGLTAVYVGAVLLVAALVAMLLCELVPLLMKALNALFDWLRGVEEDGHPAKSDRRRN